MKNQPFLFRQGDHIAMLGCRSGEPLNLQFGRAYQIHPWKIWLEGDLPRPLPTPTQGPAGAIVVECNPHLFRHDDRWHLGYCAGFNQGPGTPVVYHHVWLETDLSLGHFGPLQFGSRSFSACRVGQNLYSVQKTADGDRLLRDGLPVFLPFACQSIYRICPVFERDDMWLMTVADAGLDRSWLVTAASLQATPVLNAAGQHVYKCSLLDDHLAYTVKGPGQERSILIETL